MESDEGQRSLTRPRVTRCLVARRVSGLRELSPGTAYSSHPSPCHAVSNLPRTPLPATPLPVTPLHFTLLLFLLACLTPIFLSYPVHFLASLSLVTSLFGFIHLHVTHFLFLTSCYSTLSSTLSCLSLSVIPIHFQSFLAWHFPLSAFIHLPNTPLCHSSLSTLSFRSPCHSALPVTPSLATRHPATSAAREGQLKVRSPYEV